MECWGQFNSDSENNSENPPEFLDMSKLKIFEFFIYLFGRIPEPFSGLFSESLSESLLNCAPDKCHCKRGSLEVNSIAIPRMILRIILRMIPKSCQKVI